MKPRHSEHGVRIPKCRISTYDPVVTVVEGGQQQSTQWVSKKVLYDE